MLTHILHVGKHLVIELKLNWSSVIGVLWHGVGAASIVEALNSPIKEL